MHQVIRTANHPLFFLFLQVRNDLVADARTDPCLETTLTIPAIDGFDEPNESNAFAVLILRPGDPKRHRPRIVHVLQDQRISVYFQILRHMPQSCANGMVRIALAGCRESLCRLASSGRCDPRGRRELCGNARISDPWLKPELSGVGGCYRILVDVLTGDPELSVFGFCVLEWHGACLHILAAAKKTTVFAKKVLKTRVLCFVQVPERMCRDVLPVLRLRWRKAVRFTWRQGLRQVLFGTRTYLLTLTQTTPAAEYQSG